MVDEADYAHVRSSRHAHFKVPHQAKHVGNVLKFPTSVVGDTIGRVAFFAFWQVLHSIGLNLFAVLVDSPAKGRLVVGHLQLVPQLVAHLEEGRIAATVLNVLQVIAEELAFAHPLLADGAGAADLRPDAGSVAHSRPVPQPVVPEGGRPAVRQLLLPQSPTEQPTEARKEVGPVKGGPTVFILRFNHPAFAVVVPGADAHQRPVRRQQRPQREKVLEKVRREGEVVLDHYQLVDGALEGAKGGAHRPVVVPGDAVVALQLALLFAQPGHRCHRRRVEQYLPHRALAALCHLLQCGQCVLGVAVEADHQRQRQHGPHLSAQVGHISAAVASGESADGVGANVNQLPKRLPKVVGSVAGDHQYAHARHLLVRAFAQ